MDLNNEILQKISELIPKAPCYWVDVIAEKMGKSKKSVYAYCIGSRGIRKGQHKEVLRLLKTLVAKESETDKILLK